MHDGQLPVDAGLVRRLLRGQHPQWADLPLTRVESSGTVNAIYRLGDALAVRLPLLPEFADGIKREAQWLPHIGPLVPLETPQVIAVGEARDEYPLPWSVVRWIDGENATTSTIDDLGEAARRLGEFVVALRSVEPWGGPNSNYRGRLLAERDEITRRSIEQVGGEFDTGELVAAWEACLNAAPGERTAKWFHGDLHSGNLLARNGELVGVIDFGGCSVGEPSSDLIAGWWLFDEWSRTVFRHAVDADDESWARGRGWALSIALVALPYYVDTNPVFADMARTAIRNVLDDSR